MGGPHDRREAMGARLTPNRGTAPSRDELSVRFAEEGLRPRWWGNAADDVYGSHEHEHAKVLYCLEGSITFHTDGGDLELRPGDRLDLDAGTSHAATVGPNGVTCVEAYVEG